MSKMQNEKSQLLRDALYNVLIVLGIEQHSWLKKLHCSKSTIHRNMFQYPKSNIFQVVSYFLFSILDGQKCLEDFHYCWPVGTRKEEQDFRKICFSWLTRLAQEDGSNFPKFTPSILLSPGLDKFCHLYLAVARLALHKVFIEEYQKPALILHFPKIINSELSSSTFEIISASKHHFLQIYKNKEEAGRKRHAAFSKNAKILIDQNHKLRKDMEEFEKYLSQNPKTKNQEKYIKNVRKMWCEINVFANLSRETTAVLESTLGISSTSNELDGQKNIIEPSKNFIMQHRNELEVASVDRIYEGGVLQVENLLKMMEIILQSYSRSLKNVTNAFSPFAEMYIPIFRNLTACHKSNFKSLVEIDNKLENCLLPEIQHSIQKLEQIHLTRGNSISWDASVNSSLDILRITPNLPPVLKKNSDVWTKTVKFTPIEQVKNLRYQNLRMQSDLGSSPKLAFEMKNPKVSARDSRVILVDEFNSYEADDVKSQSKLRSKIPMLKSSSSLYSRNILQKDLRKSPIKNIDEEEVFITPKKSLIDEESTAEIEASNMIKTVHINNFSPIIVKCINALKEPTNFTFEAVQSETSRRESLIDFWNESLPLISSLDEDFWNDSLNQNNLLDFGTPNSS